jgi:hypothetical protein
MGRMGTERGGMKNKGRRRRAGRGGKGKGRSGREGEGKEGESRRRERRRGQGKGRREVCLLLPPRGAIGPGQYCVCRSSNRVTSFDLFPWGRGGGGGCKYLPQQSGSEYPAWDPGGSHKEIIQRKKQTLRHRDLTFHR